MNTVHDNLKSRLPRSMKLCSMLAVAAYSLPLFFLLLEHRLDADLAVIDRWLCGHGRLPSQILHRLFSSLLSSNASNVGSNDGKIFGCLPCSQKHALPALILISAAACLNRIFMIFLAQEFNTHDLCRGLANDMNVLGLVDLHKHLSGEGFHRYVVSTLRFVNQSYAMKWLDFHSCEAVIIERLPIGVVVDPFELQHLVHRRAFPDAAIFGGTDLELPYAQSNDQL